MIEIELYAHLRDNVALVDGRIFPKLMPQDCIKPSLVYGVVNDSDVETLGCVVGSSIRFQIDVYGFSYSEVKMIKQQVKAALYSFKYKPLNLSNTDDYEDETKLYREMLDFNFKI